MILSQIGWQIDIFVVCLCVMQMFRLDCIWSIFVFKFWLANMQYMVIAVLKVGSMQNWLPSQTGSCCKQSSSNSTTSVFVSVLLFQGVVGALLVKYHTVLLFLKLFPPQKKCCSRFYFLTIGSLLRCSLIIHYRLLFDFWCVSGGQHQKHLKPLAFALILIPLPFDLIFWKLPLSFATNTLNILTNKYVPLQ